MSNGQEVVITEYVYNFGPRKFMRRLLFEGGILVSIEKIGYGYRDERGNTIEPVVSAATKANRETLEWVRAVAPKDEGA